SKPMIRISFETTTDSADPHHPEAWRKEAAAMLRKTATRIKSGEPMPLQLFDDTGVLSGKARELSYHPDPPKR
ncbi:MAG: hypothetical protein ABI600_15070, partial [Luteolibacter sp.]